MSYIEELGKRARFAKNVVQSAGTRVKNEALREISEMLLSHKQEILQANDLDVQAAKQNGMTASLLDRLTLTEARIEAIAGAVRELIELPDPVGRILDGRVMENGLRIRKVTVPLGTIGMIYEARPNVTVDAATLCLKAGNTVMLRGGKDAFHSCLCLANLMRAALKKVGLPEDAITFVEQTDRETAGEMMRLNGYLDVLIPRGGAGLIQTVVKTATVPVIETGIGNCHVYVDESADLIMAANIIYNAKTSRPSVCNAAESLLVHEAVAAEFLPLAKARLDEKSVTLYGCPRTREILGESVLPATEEDYAAEYIDYKLAVRVVPSIDEAIAHIARYSTGHSEAIVTKDYQGAARFTNEVDAAAVYVNASTRYTDGGEFGLGAEIGISTQKLHVRGPMGLEALVSTKFIVEGDGQIRE